MMLRFGAIHRVMTCSLAGLGILAVLTTETLSPPATLLAVLLGSAAIAIPERFQNSQSVRHAATYAPIALFVFELLRLVMGLTTLEVAIEFATFLQVIRLATRRGAAHDQQIIVIALLHFVAGTVLGGSLAFGLCFLGFLLLAPGALVLSHLRREVEGNYRQGARDRTGLPVDVPRILRSRRVIGRNFLIATSLLAVPVFLFTATLFVLFPRVGLSLFLTHPHRGGRMVGFSDHVDLGQMGTLRSDPSIAIRFEPANLPANPPDKLVVRLRGTAFDEYDGHAWQRTKEFRQPMSSELGGGEDYGLGPSFGFSRRTKLTFDLEPIEPTVVFLPANAAGIHLKLPPKAPFNDPIRIERGPEGELRYLGAEGRGLAYEVYVAEERPGLPRPPGAEMRDVATANMEADRIRPEDRARYLQLPKTFAPRITALASTWTSGLSTPGQKAFAVEKHLREDFAYDTNSPSGGTAEPIDHFLFESRRGHCEFFSTAMALMLRSQGVPTRNVTGFVGGTFNRFGRYYAIREGDAHSWVEAWIDDGFGGRWQTFDPTPAAGAQPLEATSGAWVFLRDLAEAMSQKWSRYVVGYDLDTQVHLFQGARKKYDEARQKAGISKGSLTDSLTRPRWLLLGLLGMSALAAVVARRLRRPKKPAAAPKTETELAAERIAALYERMERILARHGHGRPATTTPLKHATSMVASGMNAKVLELTETYLAVRFGDRPLDARVTEEFQRGTTVLEASIKAQKAAQRG